MNFGLKYTAGAKALAPVIVGALVVGALVLTLLLWLTSEIDQAAQDRQERLAALIVSQMESSLAHDQEGSTVWDNAVQKVKEGDQYWMDQNLGSWMHSYFGHDGAIVLDAAGKPIYAFMGDKIVEPKIYQTLASEIDPLVHDLRARLKSWRRFRHQRTRAEPWRVGSGNRCGPAGGGKREADRFGYRHHRPDARRGIFPHRDPLP